MQDLVGIVDLMTVCVSGMHAGEAGTPWAAARSPLGPESPTLTPPEWMCHASSLQIRLLSMEPPGGGPRFPLLGGQWAAEGAAGPGPRAWRWARPTAPGAGQE